MNSKNKLFYTTIISILFFFSAVDLNIGFFIANDNIQGPSSAVEDIYEDNDTFETAYELTPNFYNNSMGWYDAEYFNVSVNAGDLLQVTAQNVDNDVDVYVALYDNFENRIENSNSGNDVPSITIASPTDTFYIVYIGNFADDGLYSLNISVSTPVIPEDSFEHNNYFESATAISPGYYPNMQSYNEDYYNLSVNAGDWLLLNLKVNEDSPLDLVLFLKDNSDNTLDLEGFSILNKNDVTVSYVSNITQNLIIYIHRGDETDFGSYQLNISRVISPIIEDMYEYNLDLFEVPHIFKGNYTNLAWFNIDKYEVSLKAGELLEASITSNNDVDLDLLLMTENIWDSKGSLTEGSSNESVSYVASEDINVTIHIDGVMGKYGYYNMSISIGPNPDPDDDGWSIPGYSFTIFSVLCIAFIYIIMHRKKLS